MRSAVIIGCGFIGSALAKRLAGAGWRVTGWTGSEKSARTLVDEPYDAVACDVGDEEAVREFFGHQPAPDILVDCVSSSRGDEAVYRRVYLDGIRHLTAHARPGRLIFTSSTSVYGQTDGSIVSEESPAAPESETGRILLETERIALANGGIVARLAGLYGPGRSVVLERFLSGTAVIEEEGARYLNQVHRDDVVSALVFLLTAGEAAGIYNVCDDRPMTQLECYEWLATRFNRPVPPRGERQQHRKRAWTNKRVSNARLRALGWKPKYPSFKDAMRDDRELCTSVS